MLTLTLKAWYFHYNNTIKQQLQIKLQLAISESI